MLVDRMVTACEDGDDRLKALVLNACYTAAQHTVFDNLMKRAVAVIAVPDQISDQKALSYVSGFYDVVAQHGAQCKIGRAHEEGLNRIRAGIPSLELASHGAEPQLFMLTEDWTLRTALIKRREAAEYAAVSRSREPLQLRGYQLEVCELVEREMKFRRGAIVFLPTGAGKTRVAAELCSRAVQRDPQKQVGHI